MFRKTIMLGLCAAAVTAAALPASAMAQWTDLTSPIATSKTIELTGTNFKFSSGPAGSLECHMTAQVILHPGTTGTVTMFDPEGSVTTACKAGGALANCQMHGFQATGYNGKELTEEPWLLHTDTKDITITTGSIHTVITGQFCALGQNPATVTVTPGTLTGHVDNTHAVSTIQTTGTLQTDSILGKFATTISGVWHVKGPDVGTYGIT